MTTTYQCPRCGKSYAAEPGAGGATPACPFCAAAQGTPADSGAAPPDPGGKPGTRYCTRCGVANPENNYRCAACGADLHAAPPPRPVVVEEDGLGGLIPYKNTPALVGYYLGVFSLIPCLGLPLGIVAFVCGLFGLKRAREHPESKGKVHAWVAIGLGLFCTLANIAGIVGVLLKAH